MRVVSFIILFLAFFRAGAQDPAYAKWLIDTLASPHMHGRGYVYKGDSIAADFLKGEFKKWGLQPVFNSGAEYLQPFTHKVNTFPDGQEFRLGKKQLIPGKDYLIWPFSGTLEVKGRPLILKQVNKANISSKLKEAGADEKTILFLDCDGRDDYKTAREAVAACLPVVTTVVLLNPDKLTWSVDDEVIEGKAVLEIKRDLVFPVKAKTTVHIRVNNRFFDSYESYNVAGFIPGYISDTFLLVTAHYDHLGRLGPSVFTGANDNASGTAMMADLARHYSQINKPKYSLMFVGFAAEEAGLKGSRYFVDNPPVPLKQIRFVFNLDLMGGGETGSTVVNATEFPEEFERLTEINAQHNLLGRINKRGKAANSDHYWFSENGVPSFFMYAEGGVTAYHDVNDTRENLPLTKYRELFTLVRIFLDGFQ